MGLLWPTLALGSQVVLVASSNQVVPRLHAAGRRRHRGGELLPERRTSRLRTHLAHQILLKLSHHVPVLRGQPLHGADKLGTSTTGANEVRPPTTTKQPASAVGRLQRPAGLYRTYLVEVLRQLVQRLGDDLDGVGVERIVLGVSIEPRILIEVRMVSVLIHV